MSNLKVWIGIIALAVCSLPAKAQDRNLPASQTPQQIQTYIRQHFPQQTITKLKKEVDVFGIAYEVKLDNGVELDFDKDYHIEGIDSKTPLPASVIPQKISSYVVAQYPNASIVEWKKKRKGQKVELSNDIELYFDSAGNFLSIDR